MKKEYKIHVFSYSKMFISPLYFDFLINNVGTNQTTTKNVIK